jgi:hypothetical protein
MWKNVDNIISGKLYLCKHTYSPKNKEIIVVDEIIQNQWITYHVVKEKQTHLRLRQATHLQFKELTLAEQILYGF